MTEFIIRPYQPGDEEQIVQLLHKVFKGWPRFDIPYSSLEYWEWKYLENPLKTLSIALAISNNRVVGCYHSIQQRIKFFDRFFLIGVGVDAVVHPDYRKMGLYDRMLKQLEGIEEKICIRNHYTVSANPILLNRNLRRGYPSFPHSIMIYVRIHDVSRHLQKMPIENAWVKKLGFTSIKWINKLKNVFSKPLDKSFKVNHIQSFDERIELFWEEVKNHYDFIVERNRDYLNWRYCDSRGGEYVVKQAEESGRILGYIVIRINKFTEDYPVGYIVDLLSLPDRPDVSHYLLEDAVNYMDGEKINFISGLVVKNHSNEQIFKVNGFVNSREKINIFFKKYLMIEKIKELQKSIPDKIHFSLGDFGHI